jgi:hypothetical protein
MHPWCREFPLPACHPPVREGAVQGKGFPAGAGCAASQDLPPDEQRRKREEGALGTLIGFDGFVKGEHGDAELVILSLDGEMAQGLVGFLFDKRQVFANQHIRLIRVPFCRMDPRDNFMLPYPFHAPFHWTSSIIVSIRNLPEKNRGRTRKRRMGYVATQGFEESVRLKMVMAPDQINACMPKCAKSWTLRPSIEPDNGGYAVGGGVISWRRACFFDEAGRSRKTGAATGEDMAWTKFCG